jgi:SNF2 family DNA or RNA helicase
MATALVSAKHKVFGVPHDATLAAIVPEAVRHGDLLILPHTRDTTRLARNLGHTVPAPIIAQYDWAGDKPFNTQKITAALLTMQARAFCLSEMGTGKTRAALHAFNFLKQVNEARRAIVVAPLSTLTTVWDREIFRYFPDLSTAVLHGTRAQRLRALERDHDIYIINHDGIETILPALLARTEIDVTIIDELAGFRNTKTDRWKALNALLQGKKFAWGLTGSPTPNEPTDAWGQCRLLAPNNVPKYFKHFKQQTMRQVSQFRWIPLPDAKRIVYDAMQPSVRYRRDDCIELPPVSFQNRDVKLSADQQRIYSTLMKKLRVDFAKGAVTAVNEGVLYSKLLQITSGWVYTIDKRVVAVDNKPRIDALTDALDEAEGKVIVFAEFIPATQHLHDILQQKGYDTALVNGSVSKRDRDAIFNDFQHGISPRVLVAHPKCMAHGLTLTAADTIVWFGPTTSLDIYEQACARITRPGQTRKQLIIHLTGTPVEAKLYRRLQQKASTQGALLELFERGECDD